MVAKVLRAASLVAARANGRDVEAIFAVVTRLPSVSNNGAKVGSEMVGDVKKNKDRGETVVISKGERTVHVAYLYSGEER